MLLVASYLFYGWWDWRFLSLILVSTATDYICGINIDRAATREGKRRFLVISVAVNLGLLAFFKYWNFFIESFAVLLSQVGWNPHMPTLRVILPVGISFYTFQTMTYSIDIYRKELKPTHDFLNYALYISFFPQLVAGPIERAKCLLPQVERPRSFAAEQFIEGLQLIFWGLFKKVFVADNLGSIVDRIYGNPGSSGVEYVIATWAFAFQIYGDFSGYTDVARGSAKCMGFEIMQNFKVPYFAVNPSDFWRRWHISLSTWLRDYLYIPLGGSRRGSLMTYRNLMLTMTLGGLWHGAAWNFVLWGIFHGLLLSIHRWINRARGTNEGIHAPLITVMFKAFLMFQVTCVGWIFFRSHDLNQIEMILGMIFSVREFPTGWTTLLSEALFFILIPLVVMVLQYLREVKPGLFVENGNLKVFWLSNQSIYLKSALYGVLTYLVCLYGSSAKSFIYFQF